MAENLPNEDVQVQESDISEPFLEIWPRIRQFCLNGMMEPLFHLILILWFSSVVVTLVALKILQCHQEYLAMPNPPPHRYLQAIGDGICRRLPNPSFWAFIGLTFTGILIARAVSAIRLRATRNNRQWPGQRHLRAWAVTTLCMAPGYVFVVWLKHETFFFQKGPETVNLIQRIKVFLNLTAYLFGQSKVG